MIANRFATRSCKRTLLRDLYVQRTIIPSFSMSYATARGGALRMEDLLRLDGRPATIKDVAAHAGVSVATVSAVINGNKYVSPGLKQRVKESIVALDYERNSLAQGLKMHTSQSIGLIISDITNPYFTSVLRGVEDVANAHGYTLIFGNTDEDMKKEISYMHLLES